MVDQALADLAGLRIVDRAHPDRVVIAAGAPWFMTLFGRDSLLTAWMTLPFDATLAVGVLHALAELQGTVDDPDGRGAARARSSTSSAGTAAEDRSPSRERYYGTVDATPLFVMLAAEAWRWGALSAPTSPALAPAVDRALDWILGDGDSRRRRVPRLPAARRRRAVQPRVEGLVGRDHVRRRIAARRDRSRSWRCRATPTPRCVAAAELAGADGAVGHVADDLARRSRGAP